MAYVRESSNLVLLCRSGQRLYALPLVHVQEIMRALPVDPVPAMPDFLLGLTLMRGAAVPVVDCARLVGAGPSAQGERYVALALGERRLALAVDDVVGVRLLSAAMLADAAPLLDSADAGLVQAIATQDSELLMVLQASRLVPDSLWEVLAAREDRA
ncbi:chemotaxis protein CheW [Pseudoduganella sp. UC29_106]|uniref:chemotaxis protein CheW n=1 Tax=Pseudoduganella sp. UC29_106 TaxID=3374553 RepID=UPI0037570AC1